jgi:FkbM family methyltransferase
MLSLLLLIALCPQASASLWLTGGQGHLRHFLAGPTLTDASIGSLPATRAFLNASLTKKLELVLSSTSLPFLFLAPRPEQDQDLWQLSSRGVLEPGITALWTGLVKDACGSAHSLPALVIDVGVNWGWYSTLSSALGCRVTGFEPLPLFYETALLNIASLNSPSARVRLYPSVVSSNASAVTICSPNVSTGAIMGTAGMNGANSREWSGKECSEHVPVSLSDVVQEDVCLLKVDVEGMEPFVLQSALPLLRKHIVTNIVFEWSPGLSGRDGLPSMEEMLATMQSLHDLNYTLYELDWALAKTEERLEQDWPAAFTNVSQRVSLVPPESFSAWLNAVNFNTNLWACKQSAGPCRGCERVAAYNDTQTQGR